MSKFNLVTSQEGVTPVQRFHEIKNYFSGSALMVCELYDRNPDPVKGLRLTIKHLKQNYGRRTLSAQRMLDNLLQGGQINKNKHKDIQRFILSLETTYKRAKETNRGATFESADTINKILRQKLPFAINRWCVEVVKRRQSWGSDDEDEMELSFADFLSFLKRMNLIMIERKTISGPSGLKAQPRSKQWMPRKRPVMNQRRLMPIAAKMTAPIATMRKEPAAKRRRRKMRTKKKRMKKDMRKKKKKDTRKKKKKTKKKEARKKKTEKKTRKKKMEMRKTRKKKKRRRKRSKGKEKLKTETAMASRKMPMIKKSWKKRTSRLSGC